MSNSSVPSKSLNSDAASVGTFSLQDELPSLPVPSLDATLDGYLNTLKPFLTDAQFAQSRQKVDAFRTGEGPKLQRHLINKAALSRNWLEKWWDDYAYLTGRYPILPLVNYGGTGHRPDMNPSDESSQVSRAAMILHHALLFWRRLYLEEMPPLRLGKNKVLQCMFQYRTLYSTCRVPGKEKDHIDCHFKTRSEDTDGTSPKHIVVVAYGRYFKLNVIDPATLRPLKPPELGAAMDRILIKARRHPNPNPVGALTCLDRDRWYAYRESLIRRNPLNLDRFRDIESSLMLMSFNDELPKNESEMCTVGLLGHPNTQWADKSLVWHASKNGHVVSCCDHSPNEATVMMFQMYWMDQYMLKLGYKWPDAKVNPGLVPVDEEIVFDCGPDISQFVKVAVEEVWRPLASDIKIILFHYEGYGSKWIRSKKLYGDTVVQMAIQLAYYRLHAKPASVYETASTKMFWHGRTDTHRSCTPEVVEWARAMVQPEATIYDQFRLLQVAMETQNRLHEACQNGQGFERHLLGLRMLAKELNIPEPDFYSDPAWKKSGGDANFTLSTSFLGYSQVIGGVAPMVTDGYGCFYKIQDDRVTCFTSSWMSSKETDLDKLVDSVRAALTDIKQLVDANTKQHESKSSKSKI